MLPMIIILVVGALLATVSFFVPDKSSESFEDGVHIDDEAIKDIVDEQVKKAKESIDEAAKLSISDSKDKLERYMDRLTNEKMMAVNEYSDTVIKQIHKDHEEPVFLYDMIDNKHSQVKNTAAELGQLEKDVRRLSETIPEKAVATAVKAEEKPAVTEPVADKSVTADAIKAIDEMVSADTDDAFSSLTPEVVKIPEDVAAFAEEAAAISDADKKEIKREHKSEPKKEKQKKHAPEPKQDGPIGNEGVELMFDSDSNSMNNNDRILALHKEGKSNMAIAKELGLGVGEVKLVIDLFKSF